MTEHRTFTVEEFLQAAEKDKYPNYNDNYIAYEYDYKTDTSKVIQACVIGEAFLNLGFVENGIDAATLSYALRKIEPDNGHVSIKIKYQGMGYVGHDYKKITLINDFDFDNLSDFINELNNYNGWKGKKRVAKAVRKYFSNSLNVEITL